MRIFFYAMLALAFTVALTGCGAKWHVTDQKFFKFQNKDVRIAAKITLTDKGKLVKKDGTDMSVRLYTAEYGTILTEVTRKVGEALESSGTVNVPEVALISISDFRLGGTASNSYPDFCVDMKIENSNLPDYAKVGCLHFTDTPSESQTGGLGLLWVDANENL